MVLNYGELQTFITQEIERILDSLQKQQDQQGKQTIKEEIGKLAQQLESKGFSKEKLLVVLKEIWDPADFDENDHYKGGKQFIIATIKEMFGGDANFSGGNFKGGWNKEQDQQAINEALKPYETKEQNDTKLKPFKNWEDTQKEIKPTIISSVKKSLTPEAEAVLLDHLHTIFGADKFYPKKWKEGDKFPKERAGYYKDPKEIAMMEHQAQKEAEAMDKWDNFWKKHGIGDTTEKSFWTSKYPADPDGAEEYYNSAILQASQLVQGETPLDNLEKNRIMRATTFYTDLVASPYEAIKKAISDIPLLRKKQQWLKFFKDTDTNGEIDEKWKDSWIVSGLTIPQAETAYKNGWRNDPTKGIIKDRVIAENKTILKITQSGEDKEYTRITKDINPLTHLAHEVENAQTFIIRKIVAQTDLTKFPTDTDIDGAYNEKMVPDALKHSEIYLLRDKTRTDLFKSYFEGYHADGVEAKASGQGDKQIELWRTSDTGLKMNGAEQRKSFNNGWADPAKIINGLWPEYKGVVKISVLEVKAEQIDTAIKQADQVISNIQAFKSLRELEPDKFKDNQTIIDGLKKTPQLLPAGKLDKIDTAINNAKTNLFYHLNDEADGGIKLDRLNEIETKIRDRWTPNDYKPLTTDILNQFIKATPSLKVKGEREWKNRQGQKIKFDTPNIDEWLKDKGAYKIDDTAEGKRIIEAEDKMPLELRGSELLDYFYKKAKFDPDDLGNKNVYCITDFKREKSMLRGETITPIFGGANEQEQTIKGHLPFGTGVGKSTKVVDCFEGGGEKDEIRGGVGNRVILVMPNQVLVEAVAKHQTGWIQDWGCVWHGQKIQNAKVKKGTYIPATQEEINKGEYDTRDFIYKSHGKFKVLKNQLGKKTEKCLCIITGDELIGYMARELLINPVKYGATWDKSSDSGVRQVDKMIDTDPISKWQPAGTGALGWFETQKDIDDFKKKITEELIDRDKDIIMFDEGDTTIPAYQALQIQVANAGYRVIRMSATFEGQPFSMTSTYPRANLFAGYGGREALDPNMPAGKILIDKPEQVKRLTELRNVKPADLGWDEQTKKPIEVEVILEEALQIGKNWLFLPTLDLTAEQQRILKDISWMNYTEEWDEYVEPVSFGMPIGSLGLVWLPHGRGTNGDVDTVLLGGKMAVKTLEKRFQYKLKADHNLGQADGVQQIGRTGRFKTGRAVLLSPKWEPLNTSEDVAAAMVNGLFEAEVEYIYKKGYEMIQDPVMLRTALAVPFRFGKPCEEILIGLKVDKDTEESRVKMGMPLTKLDWRTRNEPQPDIKVLGMSFGKPDDELWGRYLGDKHGVSMKKEVAKERLLENISTFIMEDVNFPKKIEVFNQSNLIDFIWGEDIKTNKDAVIAEVKRVLNGVIKKSIDNFKREEFDPIAKTSKKREVIEKVADYYNITDAFVDISMKPKKGEEKKLVLTLQIEKPKSANRIIF